MASSRKAMMTRGRNVPPVAAEFDRWADLEARIQRAIDALVDGEIDSRSRS